MEINGKKVLVTGGGGYIGCALVGHLLKKGYGVRVFDSFFFGEDTLKQYRADPSLEIMRGNIAMLEDCPGVFDGISTVMHLAALSNDPTGELNPKYTYLINHESTLSLAKLAKESGVERFLFSSSCSIYGAGTGRVLDEESQMNPVSIYAKTKMMAEKGLLKLCDGDFVVSVLRSATAFGYSPRMRFDLVVNLMTKTAYKDGRIFVLGGGQQWRPLAHIDDISQAFIRCMEAPADKVNGEAFNVGSNSENYQIVGLADIVKEVVPGTTIEIINEDPDKRDYNISFEKIERVLGFRIGKTARDGAIEVYQALTSGKIPDPEDVRYYTLKVMKNFVSRPADDGGIPVRSSFLYFVLPSIGKEEEDEVLDSLRSGWITTGPKAALFERMLQEYTGAKYAVAVSSCTDALHLSLAALDIGVGDEVIVPDVTWPSTANVVVHLGAVPVFVDIERDTYNIDIGKIEEKITQRTKAIIPVHMAGLPVDMNEIYRIAQKHNLKVVEDAAHAIGAEYEGTKIGKLSGSVAACYSFYPIKNITTIEGGAVVTDDCDLAERVRILSLHGISKDAWKRYSEKGSIHWELLEPGYKCNMTDIQASLGIHQIKKLDGFIDIRERYARHYDSAFKGVNEIEIPVTRPGIKHARHLYIIRIKPEMLRVTRDRIFDLLKKENIGIGIHFVALHLQKYYAERFDFKREDFPNASFTSDRVLSLPLYPRMTEQDVEDVIMAVKKIVEYYKS